MFKKIKVTPKISVFIVLTLLLTAFLAAQAIAQQGPTFYFVTDQHVIQPGECVNISWEVQNASQVLYNGQPVTGDAQTRQECPTATTTYYLDIVGNAGEQIRVPLQITVSGTSPQGVNYYRADRTTINAGECVTIKLERGRNSRNLL